MKGFFESGLSAEDWLEEACGKPHYEMEDEDSMEDMDEMEGEIEDPDEEDEEIDEASKQALKKHDQGKYADGSRKRPGYDKEGKRIKKKKVRSTPKHKSTSAEKHHRDIIAKQRDRKAGRR